MIVKYQRSNLRMYPLNVKDSVQAWSKLNTGHYESYHSEASESKCERSETTKTNSSTISCSSLRWIRRYIWLGLFIRLLVLRSFRSLEVQHDCWEDGFLFVQSRKLVYKNLRGISQGEYGTHSDNHSDLVGEGDFCDYIWRDIEGPGCAPFKN